MLVAIAHAVRGDFERAMSGLAAVAGTRDLYDSWWGTQGYLALARRKELSPADRKTAAEAALQSSAGVAGWKRSQALVDTAEVLRELGETARARQTLETAEEMLEGGGSAMQGPMLAYLARGWARSGQRDRARKLLARAERGARATQNIEQPAALAQVAAVHAQTGDVDTARALFGQALDLAAGLTNSRPRALALASVCRDMGFAGLTLDEETRERLDRLHAELGDPW
jgi:tetratricopeptide (TPR) repeat protein